MSKHTGKGRQVAKIPLRAIAIPLNVAVPKTVRNNQKYFSGILKGAHAVPCPFCAEGYLYSVERLEYSIPDEEISKEAIERRDQVNSKVDEGNAQVWQCNVCEEHVETRTNNIKEVISLIQKQGRELYESGYAYQKRQEQLEKGMLEMHVDKRASYSKFFYALAIILIIPFLYGAISGKLLYSLSVMLFGVLFLLLGISNTYRAWQMYTDNVYPEDPKAQFHWWFKNKNWFLSPTYAERDAPGLFSGAHTELEEDYDENDYQELEQDEEDYYEDAQEGLQHEDEIVEQVAHTNIPNFSEMTFYYVDVDSNNDMS